jgi:hypothetical protein
MSTSVGRERAEPSHFMQRSRFAVAFVVIVLVAVCSRCWARIAWLLDSLALNSIVTMDAIYVAPTGVTALKDFLSTIDEDRGEECVLVHVCAAVAGVPFLFAGSLMKLLMTWLRK